MTGAAFGLAEGTCRAALFTVLADGAAAAATPSSARRVAAELATVLAAPEAGQAAVVHGFDGARRELVVLAAHGAGPHALGLRTALGNGVAGWVASHRSAAVVTDRAADPRGDHLAGLPEPPPTGGLAVPVPSRSGYVGGVIEVYATAPRVPDRNDLRVLRQVAALLGCIFDGFSPPARGRPDAERMARVAIAAQEAERRRLAADVHDGISQRLASLAFHLAAADDALPVDPSFAAGQLLAARRVAALAAAETRAAIGGLNPPGLDRLGLGGALASLAQALPGVAVAVDVEEGELPEHVQTALYRITQEALQNVLKHAGAARVQVSLRHTPEGVVLRIHDDGRGFDGPSGTTHGGLGLTGMHERATLVGAQLELHSTPGGGTCVEVRLSSDGRSGDARRG